MQEIKHYPDTDKIWNFSIFWFPSDYITPTTTTISWDTDEVNNSEYTNVSLCNGTGAFLKKMSVDSSYTFTNPAMVPQNYKIICSVVNRSPVFTNENPINALTGVAVDITQLSIDISDPEGDNFDWTIDCPGNNTIFLCEFCQSFNFVGTCSSRYN